MYDDDFTIMEEMVLSRHFIVQKDLFWWYKSNWTGFYHMFFHTPEILEKSLRFILFSHFFSISFSQQFNLTMITLKRIKEVIGS